MTTTGQAALFTLRGASLRAPDGPLFHSLDWTILDRRVTVLLGPAGTGKSTLLRALSGTPLPPGWQVAGTWAFRDRDLFGLRTTLANGIVHVPQRRASERACEPAWRDALGSDAGAVLLDEPDAGARPETLEELAAGLRAWSRRGAAVVVTHDLAFARHIADDVCLVADRRIVAHGEGHDFFDHPPNPLAERFVSQGNCWPDAAPPPLPSHFRWVLPDQLAGMGRPGLLDDEEQDLAAIAHAGITYVVTLTEEPYPSSKLRAFGLAGRHFAIADMGVPALGPAERLCREIVRTMAAGERVAVHCQGGLGRTGTVLASVLVLLGREPDAAVAELRALSRGYVQNAAQLDFVRRFAEAVRC